MTFFSLARNVTGGTGKQRQEPSNPGLLAGLVLRGLGLRLGRLLKLIQITNAPGLSSAGVGGWDT